MALKDKPVLIVILSSMVTIIIIGIILLITNITNSITTKINIKNQDRATYDFLAGKYHLIGKKLDSDKPYSGTIEFINQDNRLKIIRTIAGKVVSGTGKIEISELTQVKVLRIRFTEKWVTYEGTMQISSDLDNYARISGYIYRANTTKNPGLEAYFAIKN